MGDAESKVCEEAGGWRQLKRGNVGHNFELSYNTYTWILKILSWFIINSFVPYLLENYIVLLKFIINEDKDKSYQIQYLLW